MKASFNFKTWKFKNTLMECWGKTESSRSGRHSEIYSFSDLFTENFQTVLGSLASSNLIYIYGPTFTSYTPLPRETIACFLLLLLACIYIYIYAVSRNIPFSTPVFRLRFTRYIVDFVNGVILRLPFTGAGFIS